MSAQSLFTKPRTFETQNNIRNLLHSQQDTMLSLRKRALNNGLRQRRSLTTWMNHIEDLIQSKEISLENITESIPKIIEMFPSLVPNGEAFKKSLHLLSLISSTNNINYTKLLISNGLLSILSGVIKYYYRSTEKYPQDVLTDIKYIIGNIAAEKKQFNFCQELAHISSVEFLIITMDVNAPEKELWALSNLIDSDISLNEGIDSALLGKLYYILINRNEIKDSRDKSIYYAIKTLYFYMSYHVNAAINAFSHLQIFNLICAILLEEVIKPVTNKEENIVELILNIFNCIITEDEFTLQTLLVVKSPFLHTITEILMKPEVLEAIKETIFLILNNILNLNDMCYQEHILNERTTRVLINSKSKEALCCLSSMTACKMRMSLLKSMGALTKAIDIITSSQDETERTIAYEILYNFLEYISPQYIECREIIKECVQKGIEDFLHRDSNNEKNKELSEQATALIEFYFDNRVSNEM